MTAEKFEMILSRQVPDAEKQAKADFVIETTSEDAAREAVKAIVAELKQRILDA